jgi:CubicO group peptidase (beta-lactamase class C family)
MKKSLIVLNVALLMCLFIDVFAQQTKAEIKKVMDGFPASRESMVTTANYREHPFSQWSFRNIGAPLHVAMMPRSGAIHVFKEAPDARVGAHISDDTEGKQRTFENIFADNFADGVIVVQGNTILFEKYWNGLTRDYQHIWFSCSKSLASSAFGILMQQKNIDLTASPAKYIPELKGSAYERATIQDVLNMSTAMGFTESYTDTANFYYKHYGTAANSRYVPGEQTPDIINEEVLGVYDFLVKKAFINKDLRPGVKFEYSSPNVDVISWLISRISGMAYQDFVRENIWSKIGAEHDAYMQLDRAHTSFATGGMNSTLRDAALFGKLILDRGKMDGKQIVPASWVDETTRIAAADKERYGKNDVYVKANMPWVAYKNFWWILDETKGEYAAIGIHGQVVYINRSANIVIAYFSSQPLASSIAGRKEFLSKLNACRSLATR